MSPCGEFSPSELTAYLRWYKKSCSDDDIVPRLGSPTLNNQPPLDKLPSARVVEGSLRGQVLLGDHGASRRSRPVLSSPFGATRSEVYWLFFMSLSRQGLSLLGSRFLPSLWHTAAVVGTAPSWGEVVWFTRCVLETRQLWREAIAMLLVYIFRLSLKKQHRRRCSK